MEAAGLVTIRSQVSVSETIDRIVAGATRRGLIVFARIDHADGAGKIDLPVKALAWEDAEGKVWLTYNDARWLMERHGLGPQSVDAVDAIAAGLSLLAEEATAP